MWPKVKEEKKSQEKDTLILDKYFLLLYLLSSLYFIKEEMFKIHSVFEMCYA